MKKLVYLVPLALSLALALPMQGNKSATPSTDTPEDSVVVDEAVEDSFVVDSIDADDDYFVDDDWAGGDAAVADSVPVDSLSDDFCDYDEQLISEFDSKNADYDLRNPKDRNAGVSLSANLFAPSMQGKEDLKKETGYCQMVSRVLSASLDAEGLARWRAENLDKMLENRWKAAKAQYLNEQREAEKSLGDEYTPQSYSLRLTITPAWKLKQLNALTYSIEDEQYAGGAHGVINHYYFSFNQETDQLLGLADLFRAEAIPQVLELVGQKLKEYATVQIDSDQCVAEVTPAPAATDYAVLSGQLEQYEGKWIPRPALTECGIVFTYLPATKASYADGVINVLVNYAEVKDFLK